MFFAYYVSKRNPGQRGSIFSWMENRTYCISRGVELNHLIEWKLSFFRSVYREYKYGNPTKIKM